MSDGRQRPRRVAGKVAIISGGLGGIGMGIALRLGQEGAKIVLADLQTDTGAAASATALAQLGVWAAEAKS